MKPVVKICGVMRAADACVCARYGADIVGFVVEYPRPVPWNLSAEQARELLSVVPNPTQTCIVTGGSVEKIIALACDLKPNYLQLQNRESTDETAFIAHELKNHGVKIIKTLFPDSPDIEREAREFCAAGAFALLLDPRIPENIAHSGGIDFALYERVVGASSCPVFIAGGINPDNVSDVVQRARPYGIDLMTGVEESRGVKNEAKVRALMAKV